MRWAGAWRTVTRANLEHFLREAGFDRVIKGVEWEEINRILFLYGGCTVVEI